MRRNPPSARRGFSLVELLATITVLTILLGLCAGMIRLLLKLDQTGRDALAISAATNQLARDFRSDAHEAASLTLPDLAGDRVAWTRTDGSKVEYIIRPNDLLREVSQAGKLRHREIYRRSARTVFSFASSPSEGRPLVSIVIRPIADTNRSSNGRVEQIDAEFSRNQRLIARQP